jgi:DNA-binding HxlR family transcriptional regulator
MEQVTETQGLDWRSKCSIASCLDVLGDKWSLLIVRDLISHGTRTYSEFRESPEHVSTNILADRLRLLTALGIIERTNPEAAARNNAYRLTASGLELRPAVEELGRWSQNHLKQYHSEMVNSV